MEGFMTDITPLDAIRIISIKYENKDGIYEGEILHGLRHGKGTETTHEGQIYIGEYINGNFHGKGRVIMKKSKTFIKGNFENGHISGFAKRTSPRGTYKGNFVNSKRHGHGTYIWKDTKYKYIGMWENGNQHGYGKLYKNGLLIEGEFIDGIFVGQLPGHLARQ